MLSLKMHFSCSSKFDISNSDILVEKRGVCITSSWTSLRGQGCGALPIAGFALFVLLQAGCGSSSKLINESANGGTIVYTYFDEQDVLASTNRQDALRMLEAKCPSGYRVFREGQIPRISRDVDMTWKGQVSGNGQVSREKQWAIQFTCK